MAVIGAVVGVGIIGAVVYNNHSDYSDYDNYSNYSDAAERRQRRLDAKKSEISTQKSEINTYKTNNINDYLASSSLKQQSGVSVSVLAVKQDGDSKIENDIKTNLQRESATLITEIDDINRVISKIDEILKEDE